jgi:hypothetical protein
MPCLRRLMAQTHAHQETYRTTVVPPAGYHR